MTTEEVQPAPRHRRERINVVRGRKGDKELTVDLRMETDGLQLGRQGSKSVKEAGAAEAHVLKV